MKITELDFEFPEELIATQPCRPSRVMWVEKGVPIEITIDNLLEKFKANDVLVINNTKVLKRRIFVNDLEILFLSQINDTDWEVLFPAKKYKLDDVIELSEGLKMKILEKGRPQKVRLSQNVQEDYFNRCAELPLPPYIQKARGERHTQDSDAKWYQTAWAKEPGSLAAPTASLHFSKENLEYLENKKVHIIEITLHVGLGTFLPVLTDDLNDHPMHEEYAHISAENWEKIISAKRVWSLGTTATRAIESAAMGKLNRNEKGDFKGFTNLLIQPGFEFKIVTHLLTNFHQPQSTLLALVAAFSSLETVKKCYAWAIENRFRLFSYGDLSVWINGLIK